MTLTIGIALIILFMNMMYMDDFKDKQDDKKRNKRRRY